MKVLICGSRTMPWKFQDLVLETIRGLGPQIELILGGANGADTLAHLAGIHLKLPYRRFEADWETHGKRAGPIRNQRMLDEGPELVVAFHPITGCTSGTLDMIRRAQAANVPVRVVTYDLAEPKLEDEV